MSTNARQRTPLYELHAELEARMITFAGFEMPLQYPTGIVKEHNHTRSKASLFDVSHMGQIRLSGAGAAVALERLVPVDVVDLPTARQRYAFFTNDRGGISDDIIITRLGALDGIDSLQLVVNAARREADMTLLESQLGGDCNVELLEDRALIALQGPAAAGALAKLAPEAIGLPFMHARQLSILGIDCLVSRSGYTGEDGFEISLPSGEAERLARSLLANRDVMAAGLGARDTLRLEAGLCLYGQDIDESTTPVEADLAWALSGSRRPGGARAGGYPGADVIFRQLTDGVARRRVSLRPRSRVPVRAATDLYDESGSAVGTVTSGSFGPTIVDPVAMGYVAAPMSEPGTLVFAKLRGKTVPIEVVDTPVVAHRYFRG